MELFRAAIEENKLESEVTLAGSFYTGKCNRVGVTVAVDDETFTGITPENFNAFFETRVLKKLSEKGK